MGFLRRTQNLKKSSTYFWQEHRVLCVQQRTCQKVDEDFSKQMWSSRSIQTLLKFSCCCSLGKRQSLESKHNWREVQNERRPIEEKFKMREDPAFFIAVWMLFGRRKKKLLIQWGLIGQMFRHFHAFSDGNLFFFEQNILKILCYLWSKNEIFYATMRITVN